MQVRRRLFGENVDDWGKAFASDLDHAECRRLHRHHGTTYYYSTCFFPGVIRRRTHAVYAFVRVADEWVDNPGTLNPSQRYKLLEDWRSQLLRGLDGVIPTHPVMRAFCDVCREVRMPVEEPLLFLQAMEQDLSIERYRTYDDLRRYMRGSAAAVGAMMCWVIGARPSAEVFAAARALGEAMQLTNFLRDVGEDAQRGRIYLPLEDLASFGVSDEEIMNGRLSDRFVHLMRFEIERARALYQASDAGINGLPRRCRPAIRLARLLYGKILDKIEENGYDVFRQRASTTRGEKVRALGKAFLA